MNTARWHQLPHKEVLSEPFWFLGVTGELLEQLSMIIPQNARGANAQYRR